MRIAVLASGEGTNLQAILDAVHGREAEVVGVASDKLAARALDRGRRAGVPTAAFPLDAFADRALRDAAMDGWVAEQGAELCVLAGYMAVLDRAFVRAWEGRLINVHPSLLPAFTGLRAVEQALDYGTKVFGVTVHLVDEGLDTGPVLLQRAIDLPSARTPEEVQATLRPIEHALLCEAVRRFARGEVVRDPQHPRRWRVGLTPLPPPGQTQLTEGDAA